MKKNLLLLSLLLGSFSTFAQTDHGDYLVGGNLGFRTNSNNSSFTLTPNVGYFFAKNFAACASVTLDFQKKGNVKTTDIGLGPFARYYLGQSNFRPFLHGGLGFASSTYKENSYKTTATGFYTTLGLGYAAFISPSVAFEGLASYNYTQYKNASSANGFGLNFGFQVYIDRNKMTTLRRGKLE